MCVMRNHWVQANVHPKRSMVKVETRNLEDTEAEFLFWTINQFHYHYFTFRPQLLIVDSSH